MPKGKPPIQAQTPAQRIIDTAGGLPQGIAYERGFHILGTPIGFKGARNAELQFLSRVDDPLPRGSRSVLTTPFIAGAIGARKRGLDCLSLGYGRRIRLGKLDMRLFPAGLGPGSAQLEVAYKDRKIVFCGGVRLASLTGFSPAEFSKTDLLLLDVEPAEPRPPSPERVIGKLKQWLKETAARGQIPVLCFGSLDAVFAAGWALRDGDSPVYAHRSMYEMMKRVGDAGVTPAVVRRLQQRPPKGSTVFHSSRLWPHSKLRGRGLRTAYVGPGRAVPKWASAAFRLGESEARSGLVSYVTRMQPSQIVLGPGCDEATSSALSKAGFRVFRIHEARQMLFSFF